MSTDTPDTSVQRSSESPYRRYRGSDVEGFQGTLANIRALGRAVPVKGDLPDLGLMVELHADLDEAIGRAVAGFLDQGMSWRDIAAGMGVTRSTAHERWARRAEQARS